MTFVGVDTGGTFTDFVAVGSDGQSLISFKVPSVPDDPARAVAAGLDRLHTQHGIAAADIGRLMFGTTVATNAVLEGKGARTALVTTRGTRDVIEIQRMWRARLLDLFITRPPPLVPRRWRFEVDERIAADGSCVTRFATTRRSASPRPSPAESSRRWLCAVCSPSSHRSTSNACATPSRSAVPARTSASRARYHPSSGSTSGPPPRS